MCSTFFVSYLLVSMEMQAEGGLLGSRELGRSKNDLQKIVVELKKILIHG